MKKLFFLTTITLTLLFSCQDDILDREPLDIISSASVWDDPILVESYIADVYRSLPFMHFGNLTDTSTESAYNMPMLETLTDQAGGSRSSRDPARKKVGDTNETGGLIEMWLYPQIRKMNEFYAGIDNSSMPVDKKNSYVGAIKFAEAYSYFEMARRYGAVPLVTEAQKIDATEEELYPFRTPEVDIYNYVISVLDEIIDRKLLSNSEKSGYPTIGAVHGLKSRIALYAASISRFGTVQLEGLLGVKKSDENKFWQIAYDAADAVIQSGDYSLYNKYGNNLHERFLNLLSDETSTENIFVKFYDGSNIGHSYDAAMAPVGFAPIFVCASAAPYLDFVEKFEKIDGSSSIIPREWESNNTLVSTDDLFGGYDPRMSASILHEGSIYQGEKIEFYQGLILPDGTIKDGAGLNFFGTPLRGKSRNGLITQDLYTGFSVRKYLDEKYIDPQSGQSSSSNILIRLAEMYLNRAEAAFYLNYSDKGLSDINIIRNRAGMPPKSSIDEEAIRYERMAELCFENGNRYWDLIRWRTAHIEINKDFSGIRLIKKFNSDLYQVKFINFTGSAPPFESRFGLEHYYKPITPGRISNNPNLAPENPNY
ncbi:MAG: RagB/SusD family nutrient uptake outer membrane protein [Jejuia sp.]